MDCFNKKYAYYYLLIFYSILRICWRFLILYFLSVELIDQLKPAIINTLNTTIQTHITNYSTATICLSIYTFLFEVIITTSTLYSNYYTKLINFSILLIMSIIIFISNLIIYFSYYNNGLSLCIILLEPVIIFNSIVLVVSSKIKINKITTILPNNQNHINHDITNTTITINK